MSIFQERDAGMTEEVSKYVYETDTVAVHKLKDFLCARRDAFYYTDAEMEDLKHLIEIVKEEMESESTGSV